MVLQDVFKSCLIDALNRKYFIERWIGDNTIVNILNCEFGLDFVTKRYINRYLPNIYLKEYKTHTIVTKNILNNKNERNKAVFYYFTSHLHIIPRQLNNKREWEDVYNNFRRLRCRLNNNIPFSENNFGRNW